MRQLFSLFFAVFVVVMTAAFSSPVTDKNQQTAIIDLGKGFMPVAERLGFPNFIWGNILANGSVMILEYMPNKDAKTENWSRMMTVTAYALSGDPKQDLQILGNIQNGLVSAYGKQGKIIQSELYTQGPEKYPAAFIEYKIGEGLQAEHNAGALIKPGAKLAAFVQVQCRGTCKSLTAQDIAGVRSLLGQGGGVPSESPAATKKM